MQPTTAATAVLDAAGAPYRLVHHGDVRSVEEAAIRRGTTPGRIAKTLVIRVTAGEHILVLVPGDSGLDYPKLRSLLGVRRLTMPSPEEARAVTGYERGTITPLGAGLPVFIDGRLTDHEEISLGSGAPGWAIHLSPADLVSTVGARVVDVAQDPG
jgi:Cys-tRNA(Pro) deacylase